MQGHTTVVAASTLGSMSGGNLQVAILAMNTCLLLLLLLPDVGISRS